jgi:hypothetical protein
MQGLRHRASPQLGESGLSLGASAHRGPHCNGRAPTGWSLTAIVPGVSKTRSDSHSLPPVWQQRLFGWVCVAVAAAYLLLLMSRGEATIFPIALPSQWGFLDLCWCSVANDDGRVAVQGSSEASQPLASYGCILPQAHSRIYPLR